MSANEQFEEMEWNVDELMSQVVSKPPKRKKKGKNKAKTHSASPKSENQKLLLSLCEFSSTNNVSAIEKTIRESKLPENKIIDLIEKESTSVTEDMMAFNFDRELNPIIHAAISNSLEALKFWVKLGISLESTGSCGLTPLMAACYHGAEKTVFEILKTPTAVFDLPKDSCNRSLLHLACYDLRSKHSVKIIKFLLKLYPELLQEVDLDRNSPFHFACMFSPLEVVELLMKSGCDCSLRNGSTALPLTLLLERTSELFQSEKKEKKKKKQKKLFETAKWKLFVGLVSEMIAFAPILEICLTLSQCKDVQIQLAVFGLLDMRRIIECLTSHVLASDFELEWNVLIELYVRYHKKKKLTIDFAVDEFGDFLHIASTEARAKTLEMLGSLFNQPSNSEVMLRPEVLLVIAEMLTRAGRVMMYGQQPNVDYICDFLRIIGRVYLKLFLQYLQMCKEAGESHVDCIENYLDKARGTAADLETVWQRMDEFLFDVDSNITDADRFAFLIHFFYLWTQVFYSTLEDDVYEKIPAKSVARLGYYEFKMEISEYFNAFAVRNQNRILFIADDDESFLTKYLHFMLRIRSDNTQHALYVKSHVLSTMIAQNAGNSVEICVNRMVPEEDSVVHTLIQIMDCEGPALNKDMEINLIEEPGVGSGPLREVMHSLAKFVFGKEHWFVPSPSRTCLTINKNCVPAECPGNLGLEVCGRVLGMSVALMLPVGYRFSLPVIRLLLNEAICWEDIEEHDEELFKYFKHLMETDLDEEEPIYHTITVDSKDVAIVENGESKRVTNENKILFADLYTQMRMFGVVIGDSVCESRHVQDLITGFHSVVNSKQIDIFNVFTAEELQRLFEGSALFVDDLERFVEYSGYSRSDEQIIWFWEMLREMNEADQGKLLLFWSGSQHPPIHLFQESCVAADIEAPWMIIPLDMGGDALPKANTCVRTLQLPRYTSKGQLVDKFRVAIAFGSQGYDME